MKSQSSLPIQYGTGSKTDTSRGSENNSGGLGTSFKTHLNESIIDVYERSEVNAAVPDERTGMDRRTYSTRRQSSDASTPLTSATKFAEAEAYSQDQKTNQTDNRTEKIAPAIFSPSADKGRLLDVWA